MGVRAAKLKTSSCRASGEQREPRRRAAPWVPWVGRLRCGLSRAGRAVTDDEAGGLNSLSTSTARLAAKRIDLPSGATNREPVRIATGSYESRSAGLGHLPLEAPSGIRPASPNPKLHRRRCSWCGAASRHWMRSIFVAPGGGSQHVTACGRRARATPRKKTMVQCGCLRPARLLRRSCGAGRTRSTRRRPPATHLTSCTDRRIPVAGGRSGRLLAGRPGRCRARRPAHHRQARADVDVQIWP